MTPAWIAAVASIAAALFAGGTLVVQLRSRRRHVNVVKPAGWGAGVNEIVFHLVVQNTSDRALTNFRFWVRQGDSVVLAFDKPHAIAAGQLGAFQLPIPRPEYVDLDADGRLVFPRGPLTIRMKLGWRRPEVPFPV